MLGFADNLEDSLADWLECLHFDENLQQDTAFKVPGLWSHDIITKIGSRQLSQMMQFLAKIL